MTAHHLKVAGDLPESILECIRSRSGPVIGRRPCIGRSRKRHPDRIASERSYNVPDNAGRRSRGHDRTSCMSALCTKFCKWGRSNTSQTLIKNEALPTRVVQIGHSVVVLRCAWVRGAALISQPVARDRLLAHVNYVTQHSSLRCYKLSRL